MSGSKVSKDRLTFLLGAKAAGNLTFKSTLLPFCKSLGPSELGYIYSARALQVEQQSLGDSTSVYSMVYWIY